jgi:hypothetical protein
MDRHRHSEIEARGNVLKFRPLRAGRPATTADVARAKEEQSLRHREQRLAVWVVRIWMLLAWLVALSRLRLALAHHEVFRADASVAFVVAVIIPIMRIKSIVAVLREAVAAVRRAKPGGGKEPTETTEQTSPRRTADRFLQ